MSLVFRSPLKLYDLCMSTVVAESSFLCTLCKDFRSLPNTVLLDIYERLYQDRQLRILAKEFVCIDIFNNLLFVKGKRYFLISCYQSLLNYDEDLTRKVFESFVQCVLVKKQKSSFDLVDMGLRMGSFFNDGGWYNDSILLLNVTKTLIEHGNFTSSGDMLKLLECYRLRLYAESNYCEFDRAADTYSAIKKILKKLEGMEELKNIPSLAGIFCTFSIYHFIRSEFDECYRWAIKAIELLSTTLSKRTIIDILRQTSKACVVKRKFIQAELLIRQALQLGEMMNVKERLPTFSGILMDFGFFLLNSDSVGESVAVYKKALECRTRMFEKNNILLALAHEDLAYSLYVNEYSAGNFSQAKLHAQNSIEIMQKLLPKNHLLSASAKRVKALILEEMALDQAGNQKAQHELLATAEGLHLAALKVSRESFGQRNVQTAKHYGNLGRLYQSMNNFNEAEKMHLKAISIKEDLLGPNDYEVGLSVGHLASLYNYHMKKYAKAEELYLRSIEINIRLFGPAYSGLEYDYRGLSHIYDNLAEPSKSLFYHSKFREWKTMRDNMEHVERKDALLEPKEIVRQFFEIEKEQIKLQEERAQVAEEFRQWSKRKSHSELDI